jgi:DNA (cytosine-5)-methyltransferase 1
MALKHPLQKAANEALEGHILEVESYELSGNKLIRKIRAGKHYGEVGLPSTKFGKNPKNLAEAFDKAWLTAPKVTHDSTHSKLRVVDLFAGCGGLSVGLREAATAIGRSFESVFASDIDEGALSIYSENLSPLMTSTHPLETIFDKNLRSPISDIEKKFKRKCGAIDFLIGGPPCQGHSDLNNHTRRNDPRNDLYGIMGRAAAVLNPKFVIIENVVGVQHAQNKVVSKTIEYLNGLGYKTNSITLNAAHFGVAQNRKRHFTLATRGDVEKISSFLKSFRKAPRNIMWAIGDIADEPSRMENVFCTASAHSPINKKRIEFLFKKDIYELPDSQRPDCHRLKPHAYKSVYGRIRPDSQAPTITSGFGSTGQGRFVHPYQMRTLTPHEAARIQFFPDWFKFENLKRSYLQKYIGNAVPPKIGYVLGLSLLGTDL